VTAPAGFVPSAATMVAVWALLAAEAMLLAESNLAIRAQQVLSAAASAVYTLLSCRGSCWPPCLSAWHSPWPYS